MRKTTKWMKKIKEPNKWRDILSSWIRRLNIVKMSVLPIYTFNAIPINTPVRYFIDTDKNYKVYMDRQKAQNS